MSLIDRFDSSHALLAMQPEELGAVLLVEFHAAARASEAAASKPFQGNPRYQSPWPGGATLEELLIPITDLPESSAWPGSMKPQIKMAAFEAWSWLVSAGLIVPHPNAPSSHALSRRGIRLTTEQAVLDYRNDGILPIGLLHPRIMTDVVSHFLRQQYDTAVFHAFREIEIALREAVPGDSKRDGHTIVNDAYHTVTGKLRNPDPKLPYSEREGEYFLFRGAIGTMKNPCSHRRLPLERGETARLVLFASELLFRIDKREVELAEAGDG